MKKQLAFLMALLLLGMVGCTKSAQEEMETDEWGIALLAEQVTPTGMTLVCVRTGGTPTGELQTGSPFALEQLVDDAWTPVPTVPGILDLVWTMEGWMIQKDSTTKWEVNWEFLYGALAPGQYRIQKEIMDFRGPGDFTEKDYYAQFIIAE